MFTTTYSASDARSTVGCSIRQSTFATLPARIIAQARMTGYTRVEVRMDSIVQAPAPYVHWLRRVLRAHGIHLIDIRATFSPEPPFRA